MHVRSGALPPPHRTNESGAGGPSTEVVFSEKEERSTFRGLLSTPSAMVMWGYLAWASPSASICLHPSHSACASWCLRLCQPTLIIRSCCDATRRDAPGLFQSHTCAATLPRDVPAPYRALPVGPLLEDFLHIDVYWKSFYKADICQRVISYCSVVLYSTVPLFLGVCG